MVILQDNEAEEILLLLDDLIVGYERLVADGDMDDFELQAATELRDNFARSVERNRGKEF